jgi:hypothetical protein
VNRQLVCQLQFFPRAHAGQRRQSRCKGARFFTTKVSSRKGDGSRSTGRATSSKPSRPLTIRNRISAWSAAS